MNATLWKADDDANVQLYTRLADEHGLSPQALDWGSRQSQQLRFRVLAEVGDLNDCSLLDVGCGQGDFYQWLVESNTPVRYHGLDITPRMIEDCRRRFDAAASNQARFAVGSLPHLPEAFDQSYDYVMASGIFAHRRQQAGEFLQQMVTHMFERCRLAAAFNSLSDWAGEKEGREFHADPCEVLHLARRLTPHVALRHDYHPRDFTVYLYKQKP